VNDAERLCHDPAMRWIVGGKAAQRSAASPSQMGRFETQWLAAPENFAALAHLSDQWIDLVHGRRPPRGIVLDMDSSVSPTHSAQEMSVWNGHYACTCYHPLFVFNQFGDLERCALRAGNVDNADGWDAVLKPVVARYRARSHASISGLTPPLQCPRSTSFWRRSGSNTRSGYPPTRFCRAGSAICSRVRSGVLRTMCADPMRASAIRPEPGPSRGGSSPRLNGIASCARLQPRQFPAHAGDAEADQGLVADESEGQADQDRRKVVSHGRYVIFQMAEVAIARQMFQESYG